jgi:hypothetical protein
MTGFARGMLASRVRDAGTRLTEGAVCHESFG